MYIKTYAQVEFLQLRFDEFHDNIKVRVHQSYSIK